MAEYVNIKTDNVDKNVPTKDTFEASLPKSKAITLTANSWSNNTQTVSVNGVSANEANQLITISPAKTKISTYIESGIYCSGQAENSLTFTCSEAPTENITIYVIIEPVVFSFSLSSVLDENSWEDIQLAAELGIGQNYWSVGDCKKIVMNGKVSDGLTLTNFETYVYIIGFNHNAEKEGNGIAFQGFKTAQTGGTNICLVDSGYNTNQMSGTWFYMNNTGAGGWETSIIRKNVMPLIKAAFPADLQAVIKTSTEFTAQDSGNVELTATEDEVFLLAEYEVFGTNKYASKQEPNYLKQYSWYSAGNSKKKYKHNDTSTSAIWFGRSHSSSYGSFCSVAINGSTNSSAPNYSYGVSPCFKV